MSSHFKGADGDWICGDVRCGNLNFARRSSCNRCGKQKEINSDSLKKKQGIEIGKAAAEKSHGLFSAEDWQCSKCGNVNWARRQTCNMCNAPKVGEVEERTGYGGGFNEREGVEYIERDESDDEFDEFGRKKKKFRNTQPETDDDKPKISPGQEIAKKRNEDDDAKKKNEDGDDEEEAEEEGDDEDLSKYDLWQDDDNEEQKDEKNEEDSKSTKVDCERDSRSSSPHSRHSSNLSSRGNSSSKDRSPSRDGIQRSPRRYRDRSRSQDRGKPNRRRSSDSRSRSYSRSRSRSRERKHSRR